MRRAALLLLALIACKSSEKQPGKSTGTGTVAVDAGKPAVDAMVAGVDCAKVGAKMRSMIRPNDPTSGFEEVLGAAVDAMFTAACAQDGWPDDAATCVIDVTPDQGVDACFQRLSPYAIIAMGARRQELPTPTPPPGPMCDDAARAIGFAWTLQLAKAAPAGASTRTYTELFQGLANELEELCNDDADSWTTDGRACLVGAHLPEELAKVEACVARLPAEAQRQLAAYRTQVETGLATQTAPGTPTGGDDCAAVGDAMVQIWTLKAQKSMAKHPDTAQWDLDHLGELRALVIGACTEDKWPELVRTCITGLKLPNEASAFGDCIGGLPPEAMDALGKRTAVLEAERDKAIGQP